MTFQDFASAPRPSSRGGQQGPPLMYGGSSTTSSSSTLADDGPAPPRTPAMQFYTPGHSHSSHSQQLSHSHSSDPNRTSGHSYARQTAENIAAMHNNQGQMISSSSSSSSLSSMAAALVSGGPVLQHHVHQQQQSIPRTNSRESPRTTHGEDSPISPAAMIGGNGHENLMLPPPSRIRAHGGSDHGPPVDHPPQPPAVPASSSSAKRNSQSSLNPNHPQQSIHHIDHSNKEEHLNWLKELNARAKAANQPPPNQQHPGMSAMPPPNMVQMHPQQQQQQPGVVFPQGPYNAAAAAAVAQNPMLYQAAMNHKFHMAAQSQGESEEKRARRLERNRESARKSRRRKKERLAALEKQVDELHTKIEEERKKQVAAMCNTLKQVRLDELAKLQRDCLNNPDLFQEEDAAHDRLANIIKSTSGGSQIAQATIEFQYNTLKQVLLPRYQKFLLWLTLHEESFFAAGKDEYTKKDGKQVRL